MFPRLHYIEMGVPKWEHLSHNGVHCLRYKVVIGSGDD